jgi:hypothetical protein
MTQDQRGPGYVARDDAVPEDEEYTGDQTKPMTRFQKVASALRGAGAERDEYDEAGADRDVADRDVQADHGFADRDVQADHGFAGDRDGFAGDRDVQADRDLQADQGQRDYWDDSAAGRAAGQPATSPAGRDETVAAMDPDVPVDQTNPDVPIDETRAGDMDHPATEPDLFGNTTRPAGGTGTVSPVAAAEGQPGAATIADVPGGASVTTATGAQEADVPEADFRAAGTPETATPVAATPADAAAADADAADAAVPAAGSMGRHAAAPADVAAADAAAADAAPADRELRPGEATVSLGDFSDLTYGNLIPDTAVYTEQWQQIQFKFVDDPHASVTEAADVVAQVTAKMEAAIQERQRAISERQQAIQEQQRSLSDRWGKDNNADTENLRETLRMYKTFLDQLIGPRATS